MSKFLKALGLNVTAVVLVAGIIVAVNVIALRFAGRLDVTEEQEFTLSPATRDVLSRLKDRLTIKLYYSQDLPAQLATVQGSAADTLAEIKAAAPKSVIIESADPDSNELKERETLTLGITPLQLNIVAKDKRELKKIYMGMALYYQDKKEVIPVVAQVQNLEYQIALSLLKMTEKELPRIGVLLPKDEMVAANYGLLPRALGEIATVVPLTYDDKDLEGKRLKSLVIIDPREVTKEFAQELDNLLNLGVNVLIFASRVDVSGNLSPTSVSIGLDDWFNDKGVGLSEKLLLDARQNEQAGFNTGMMQVFMRYPFWVKSFAPKDLSDKNPITAQLEEVLMPWTNVIEKNDRPDNPWVMTPLVSSSQTSFLQQDGLPGVAPEYTDDMTEPPAFAVYPISALLENGKDKDAGRIFLTANANILRDNFLQQAPTNAIFVQNMIEYASWGKDLIAIRSRGKTARPLAEISEPVKSAIKWGHMVGVPLGAVLLGLGGLLIIKKRRQAFIAALAS